MTTDQIIRRLAAQRGYNRSIQDALVGIAHHESGLNPRSLGDGGTSIGLFQLHRGAGTLGNINDAGFRSYADPRRNTNFALDHLKGILSNSMSTAQAVDAISRRFERPADPGHEIASALAYLRSGGSAPGVPSAALPPTAGVAETGIDPQDAAAQQLQQTRITAANANTRMLHLPFIKLPDIGPTIPFQATTDPGVTAPPPSDVGNAVVKAAKHFLGIQYKWGGNTPQSGFDCSGLTKYVMAKFGITIPRVAADQFNAGHKVSAGQARPGDLVFFSSSAQGVHHVGIYIGHGMFLQAPHTGDVVKISRLGDRSDIAGFRRFAR